MSELFVWSDEEAEELLQLVIKLLNGCIARNKIIERIQKMTGVKSDSQCLDSSCSPEFENSTEIRSFSRSNEDKVGGLIDCFLNRNFIFFLLPRVINKAFLAFSSLKETCIQKPKNTIRESGFDVLEYNLMITVFIESISYYCADKIMEEIKNNYTSSVNDILRWASPHIIKDKAHKIDNQMLFELHEYGITMKSAWIGEDRRKSVNKEITKMDYQSLFTNNSNKESSFGANIRYMTLESNEFQDELLFYFKSIEHIPNELNAKLGGNLNSLSKSLYILSIEPNKIGFTLGKNSGSYIPGSKLAMLYFPCTDKIGVNCQNSSTNKSVEFELSDDKLIIADLHKNKYTFRNASLEIVTYCILTYVFSPT